MELTVTYLPYTGLTAAITLSSWAVCATLISPSCCRCMSTCPRLCMASSGGTYMFRLWGKIERLWWDLEVNAYQIFVFYNEANIWMWAVKNEYRNQYRTPFFYLRPKILIVTGRPKDRLWILFCFEYFSVKVLKILTSAAIFSSVAQTFCK